MSKLVLIAATGRKASAQTLTTLDSFSATPQAVFDATEYCAGTSQGGAYDQEVVSLNSLGSSNARQRL